VPAPHEVTLQKQPCSGGDEAVGFVWAPLASI
jgi:hypothetical protein